MRPFGPRRAAIVFAAYIAAQFATGIAVGVLFGVLYGAFHRERFASLAGEIMGKAELLGGAAGVLVGGALVLWLARRMIRRGVEGISLEALGWKSASVKARILAALAGALIGITFLAASLVFPMTEKAKPAFIETLAGGGWPFYVWIVLALFIAPPIEEFVFRGVMWAGFARAWPPLAAGAAVTVAFVAIHVAQAGAYPPALIAIATMGVAALVARVRSGSLVPAIALHLTYNAMVAISMFRAG